MDGITLAPATRAAGRYRRQATVLAAALWLMACGQPPALQRGMEARQRVADLAVQFHRASEATNRAVMADTDAASQAFADEARAALASARAELDVVQPLIQGLGYQPEVTEIEAFMAGFARYRELDERILALAVENTNLKAQRLSFGQASTSADAIVSSLGVVAAAAKTDWRLQAMVFEVAAAVRELQVLQAPHIAAAEEPVMAGLEERMIAAADRVRQGLTTLGNTAPAATRADVGKAAQAFDAFMAAHREILALSRKNTNVRSLALVLNEKGALTRTCDEALQGLQQALESHASYGSR